MKAPATLVLLLLLSLVSRAELSGKIVTLHDYVQQVREANPRIKAAAFRAMAQQNRVSPARTWDDPFFAIGIDKAPTEGEDMKSMTQYQLSQTIPFPGKKSARGRVEQTRADAFRADTDLTTRQLVVYATQLYLRRLFNRESRELNEKLKKYFETLSSSAKSGYKTGGASHHEWLSTKSEISVLAVEKLKLEREDRVLQSLMNQLRDQPVQTPLAISQITFRTDHAGEETPPNINESPELKSLSMAIANAEAEVSLAKLNYLPDIVIQGMYEKPRAPGMMDPPTYGIMVGINIPLYFLTKQSDLVAAAESERSASELESKALENQLKSEIFDAQEQLKTAKDTATLYRNEILPATELVTKNARVSYASRRLGLSQLVETLKTQRQQQLEYLASQIDVELARLRISELLSAPPILRLAPARPTISGGGAMPTMSDTTSMGSGMGGPVRNPTKKKSTDGQTSMEGM